MRQTVRLGRVAGIPVGVHWSVLVVMVLLAQSLALAVLPGAVPGRPGWLYWVVAVLATGSASHRLLCSCLDIGPTRAAAARNRPAREVPFAAWFGGVAQRCEPTAGSGLTAWIGR